MTAQPRPPRRVSKRRREHPLPSIPSEGFTRDELDSDDSRDNASNPISTSYVATSHRQHTSSLTEPQFEVDDLDSSENEHVDSHLPSHQRLLGFTDAIFASDDDEDDPDFELASVQPFLSQPSSPTVQPLPFTLAHFASEDEDDDPDFDVHFPLPNAQRSLQTKSSIQSSDSPPCSPQHDMTYAQFLQALNWNAPTEQHSFPDAFNKFLDDDDEFDYMREAANVQEDPLEFRDDLPVSRREVAQLLSERGIVLRSQKRQRTRRVAPATSAPTNPLLFPHSVVPATGTHVPVQSMSSVTPVAAVSSTFPPPCITPVSSANAVVSTTPAVASNTALASRISQQQALRTSAVAVLSPHFLVQFQQQLKAFVQILAHIHANSAKSARISGNEEPDPLANDAHEKSEIMLKRVVENRKMSISYHEMLETQMMRIALFSDGLAFRQFEECFSKPNRKKSVYAVDGLEDIELFLNDCRTLAIEQMPSRALERVEKISQPHLKRALLTRKRQFTLSGAREGWFIWTAEDDRLLALTIAKYGREVAEYSKDLLPHRLEDDCQARVRHLCSRRCTGNAVKRQMMLISAPLNQQEVKLVQHGLRMFGGRVEDEFVWKRIQKELLPGRQWSLLQKLWLWRETRKKTKARYRAKVSQKKKAMRSSDKSGSNALADG
eukprot:gb/GEZJ01002465.1/.p1 GENE.gb/GEZJ01002465.1/~~gb/GEZJ01002465.1/.p1  ORF type:complete len:692 (+),score=99.46 gb/GEZJ01002465.1/:90-2078(+)